MRTRKVLAPLSLIIAAACGGGTSKDPAVPDEPTEETPGEPTAEGGTESPTSGKAKVATPDALKKHLDDTVAAWNAHDAKKLTATYTADAVVAMPGPNGLEESKPSAMEQRMGGYFTAFPDMKMHYTHALVDGNVAVVRWVVTGTNTGEFMGEKATGKKIGYAGVSVLWFADDGKAKREHVYFDTTTLMGQMGKLPKGQKVRAALEAPTTRLEMVVAKPGDEKHEAALKNLYASMEVEKPDVKAMMENFTDDVVVSNSYMPADTKGKKAVEKETIEGSKAFVGQKTQVSGCWAAGDYAACEFMWTATWKGPAMGMPPTNKTGSVHGLEVARFKDGKIAETHGFGSGAEFAMTFGLTKPAKPAPQPAASAKPSEGAKNPAAPKTEPPKTAGKEQPGQTQPAKAPGSKPDAQPKEVKKP